LLGRSKLASDYFLVLPQRKVAHWQESDQKRQVTALIQLRNKNRKAAAMNENKVPLEVDIK
jgi:hypothetical protein